jgi:hypothetical protein
VAGEIEPAEDRSHHRHDDVLGQARRDLGERGADDHGHGQVEYVAFRDECPEVFQHGPLRKSNSSSVECAIDAIYLSRTRCLGEMK